MIVTLTLKAPGDEGDQKEFLRFLQLLAAARQDVDIQHHGPRGTENLGTYEVRNVRWKDTP